MASLSVRVTANITELRAAMKETEGILLTTKAEMTKFGNAFDGSRIIAQAGAVQAQIQAIGGVANLTGKEQQRANSILEDALAKYAALGREAPQGMRELAQSTAGASDKTSLLAGSFARLTAAFTAANMIDRGASALIQWGIAAIDSAGRTIDLADKTGLSTRSIQQMEYVALQTGTSLSALSNAATKLGVNISGGSGSVRDGVDKLGLSFNELRAMKPDEQFNAVIASLERMENPQERNRLAIQLFGKAGAEILPAIAQGYSDLANQARIAGDTQLRAVDTATDAWGRFKSESQSAMVQFAGNVFSLGQHLAHFQMSLLGVDAQAQIFGDTAGKTAGPIDEAGSATLSWSERLTEAEAQLAALSAEQLEGAETAKRLGATVEEITDAFGLSAEAQRLLAESTQEKKKADSEAESAAKKHADAVRELTFAGDGWKATLAQMSTAERTAIEGYLKAGVSQSALAEIYGKTAQQIKAVALSLDEQKEAAKRVESITAQLAKVRAENTALEVAMSGSSRQAKIADIHAEYEAAKAALIRKKEFTAEIDAELQRQRDLKIAKEGADFARVNAMSRTALEERAAFELNTYLHMASQSDRFSAGALARQKERYLEAQDAARNWRQVQEDEFGKAGKAVKTLEGTWDSGFKAMSESVEETLTRMGKLKKAVSEVFSMSIQPLTGYALENAINRGRVAGGTEADALKNLLSQLEAKEGRYQPTDNASYFSMLRDQELLAQLRMLQGSGIIPGFANGVENFRGGLAYVHRGELLVNLPSGTDVVPASRVAGGTVINIGGIHLSGRATRRDGETVAEAIINTLKPLGLLPEGGGA